MTAKKIISLLLMLLLACTAVYGFTSVDRPGQTSHRPRRVPALRNSN